MKGLIRVRLAVQDDLRFVCASWFESYWKLNAKSTGVAYEEYKHGQDRRIRKALERSKVQVLYASEIPDELLGFSVVEGPILHYAYVKSVYRREGLASKLCEGTHYYTHRTAKAGQAFCAYLNLKYDPYLLDL